MKKILLLVVLFIASLAVVNAGQDEFVQCGYDIYNDNFPGWAGYPEAESCWDLPHYEREGCLSFYGCIILCDNSSEDCYDFSGCMFSNGCMLDPSTADECAEDNGCEAELPCTANWTCTGYGSCNISDLAPCNNVTDLNSCGDNYTGDYSEFSPQSCNYCAYDLELLVTGTCNLETGIRGDTYIDNNFGTCCNVTGLESDCAFGTDNETGIVNNSCSGNYNSDYESEDMAKVVVDGLVILIGVFINFAGLLAIYLTFKFARKRIK